MILTVLFECLLGTTQAMLEGVLETVPVDKLAIHCHDTYGQALPNILTALQVSKTHIHVCMNYLFTESEVCMGKSRTETLPYWLSDRKAEVRDFSVKTECSRLIQFSKC